MKETEKLKQLLQRAEKAVEFYALRNDIKQTLFFSEVAEVTKKLLTEASNRETSKAG